MMNKFKKMHEIKNKDEEREFWAKSDSTQYINWKKSERVTFSKLKPSTKTISLRLPDFFLD